MDLIVFLLFFSLFATFILFPKVTTLFSSFGMNPSLSFTILFFIIRLIPILIIGLLSALITSCVYFLISLKKKKFWIIERYLKVPLLKSKSLRSYNISTNLTSMLFLSITSPTDSVNIFFLYSSTSPIP